MEEIYKKLNSYLNEICKYLEEEDSFLLEEIDKISVLNDDFYSYIKDFPLDNEVRVNHITYEEVCLVARKIVSSIDENYLESFDKLLESGILDFSYEKDYDDSHCVAYFKNGKLKRKEININRKFNYDDVRVLIHEFIHFTNMGKPTINEHYFGEFLSIYFEMYANDYLLKEGIPKEELDILFRLRSAKSHAKKLLQYEVILLAYSKFGKIDESTVPLLQEYFLNINEETFNKECESLFNYINKLECKYDNDRREVLENICEVLNEDYRYLLGTVLAIYARKYASFDSIVKLNNHINNIDNLNVSQVCKIIGIDITKEEFEEEIFTSLDEYMSEIGLKL